MGALVGDDLTVRRAGHLTEAIEQKRMVSHATYSRFNERVEGLAKRLNRT
jgi:hypothetical protein